MVYVPPSELGQTTRVSGNEDDNKTKKPGEKHTLAPSGEDSFVGKSWKFLSGAVSGLFEDILPGGEKLGERISPPQPISLPLTERLRKLGYSEKQISQIISQATSRDVAGLPSLSDYAGNDRYELRERRYEHHHGIGGGIDLQALHADKELSAMFQKMQERNMLDMLEDQELAKVFLAMSAIAYNPKYAVRQLASLASSLQTPAAVQFASSQLSNATSFATKWAMKVAKDDPEFAKDLAKALKGIVISATNNINNFAHIYIGTSHECEGAHVPDQLPAEAVTEECCIEVVDRETGEMVDSFVVEVHTHEVSEAYQQSQSDAYFTAGTVIDDAADLVENTAKDAERIHEKHIETNLLAIKNADKVTDLDRQIIQSKNDPEKVSNLTQKRSDTLSKGRFIASA